MIYPATKRQLEVLAVIKRLIAEHGVAPSNREIAAALGVGEGTASMAVKRLVARGQLRKLPNARRTLVVCDKAEVAA